MLEVDVHPDPAIDENREGHGPEGSGNRRLASKSFPVEQGRHFATSTGTIDREEITKLSDSSTENMATARSPTDHTMMHGVREKPATPSSFSERVKNTLGNFFPFTKGTGTEEAAETQEEKEDDDEQDDFGSQVSLNSSTRENDTYTNRETGSMDRFGVVRTISKTTNGSGQSGDFVTMTKSEMRIGKNRNTGLCNPPAEQKRILKRRLDREIRLKSRPAPSYLEPIE